MKGKWYLRYLEFDSMENRIEAAQIKSRVELAAKSEEEAIREAKKKWDELLAKGTYAGWDGQTYPQQPRVIYFYEVPSVDWTT
jgi:hypothetical protein